MAPDKRSSNASSSSNAATMVTDKEFWHGRKKQFGVTVGSSFMLIQLLFLTVISYLFGSMYRQSTRIHSLKVLGVDYDGGIIGQSVQRAYESLAAPSFPSIEFKDATDGYTDVSDVVEAVRRGDYWGAVYTHAGASNRLADALTGGEAAWTYNSSAAVTYVWNEIRYPSVASGSIKGNMETLIAVSRVMYTHINGTAALSTLDQTDQDAISAYLNPIQASSINIKPSPQAAKMVYNTIPLVMAIVMQFFFLMAVNGVASSLQLYSHIPFFQNLVVRGVLSLAYTFVGSLCQSGYFWAFKESWEQPASVFVLVWLCMWLYQYVQFLIFDVATTFIPMSFVPFFMLSWIIANMASTIAPFELSPGFYRWGYALPAHETWQVLITIWSNGAVNRLYRALPIMFAWIVVMLPCAFFALKWRCRKAAEAAAAEAERKEKEKDEIKKEVGGSLAEKMRGNGAAGRPAVDGAGAERNAWTESEYFPSVPTPFENTLRRVFSA